MSVYKGVFALTFMYVLSLQIDIRGGIWKLLVRFMNTYLFLHIQMFFMKSICQILFKKKKKVARSANIITISWRAKLVEESNEYIYPD